MISNDFWDSWGLPRDFLELLGTSTDLDWNKHGPKSAHIAPNDPKLKIEQLHRFKESEGVGGRAAEWDGGRQSEANMHTEWPGVQGHPNKIQIHPEIARTRRTDDQNSDQNMIRSSIFIAKAS